MTIPHDTIDKLAETYASISALGAQLDEGQWKLPSDLPGWTVQDNLAHLVGTERRLQGLPVLDAMPGERSYVKNAMGEMNEIDVEARRGKPGAEVLAEWDEIAALRIATFRAAGDEYFDAPAVTPTGPGTVADFLHIRVLDCWSHEQDIRRAAGIPGAMGTASAAHTVDRLIRTLPIVIGKRAGTPEGGAVVIDITGPVARHLTYEVVEGRAKQVDAPSSPPLATVQLDTEAFAVLALGRRSADAVADRITLDGDTALGRRIVEQLNMMI